MRWRIIPREQVKARVGDAAVMLFLWLAFLVTGCDVPGRGTDEQVQSTERVPEATTVPARQATFETYPSAPSEPVPPVRTVPEHVTYDEAETLYRDRRYDDATEYFGVYISDRPDNPWGHYMRALSAWKAGRSDEAIEGFERAIALDPNHVKSLLNLSRVLLEDDRPEDAIERIETALALDPGSSEGFRLLGVARHDLGWNDQAEDAFYQALVLDHDDAWSMNNLGLLRIRQGSFEEALPPLARAAELRPDVGVFQNNLGIALERTGYLTAAADAFRAAVASDPGHRRAETNLARVVERSDEPGRTPLDLPGLAAAFAREVTEDVARDPEAIPSREAKGDSTGAVVSDSSGPIDTTRRIVPDSGTVSPDSTPALNAWESLLRDLRRREGGNR